MRWLLYPLFFLFAMAGLGAATLATIVALAWPKLPSLEVLTDYRPQIPLRIFTSDGHLLGEFGEERRDYVPISAVPPIVRQAILAAEDERFYEHSGVDLLGVARAAMANLSAGGHSQGASTITMQVARNFFLTREKTFNRKFYEALLSFKIERSLSKDQILEIYLNQIFLGQRAYGFSSAARVYFGKSLDQLNVAEAAMLAGLPKAPSAFNPVVNPRRAQIRQQYVLRRMRDAGFIDAATLASALEIPLRTVSFREVAPQEDYVAEMARQIAVEMYGEDAYRLGIRILTTVTRADQEAAYAALRKGVLDYDRRRGYRGPEEYIDLSRVRLPGDERLDEMLSGFSDYGNLLAGVVLEASPKAVKVYRRGEVIELSGDGIKFAAPMLADNAPQSRRVRPGAVVRLRPMDNGEWELVQMPDVEAALVALDPHTGAVRALVGGFDFRRSNFNHVTQALRQPGSSFKPFIYSAALEKNFSPSTLVDDGPLHFPPEVTGSKAWEPKNYDGKFEGLMTLRTALARSRNLISIRVLQDITPEYARDFITRFGFKAEQHPAFLTMALGSGSTTPWEMASGYAVFANGGYRIQPYVVAQVIDGNGRVVAQMDPPVAGVDAARVLDARNAYLMDSMMQDVVRRGTATRARTVLKRNDLAGKTGTTNDYLDAWFCGYNPDLVAVAWLGHSQPRNLGRGETGGRAALPIWIDYMQSALAGIPERPRQQPPGLIQVQGGDDGTGVDLIYAENRPPPPPPPPEPPPDILRIFGFEAREIPPLQPQQLPAPVEERSFGSN